MFPSKSCLTTFDCLVLDSSTSDDLSADSSEHQRKFTTTGSFLSQPHKVKSSVGTVKVHYTLPIIPVRL